MKKPVETTGYQVKMCDWLKIQTEFFSLLQSPSSPSERILNKILFWLWSDGLEGMFSSFGERGGRVKRCYFGPNNFVGCAFIKEVLRGVHCWNLEFHCEEQGGDPGCQATWPPPQGAWDGPGVRLWWRRNFHLVARFSYMALANLRGCSAASSSAWAVNCCFFPLHCWAFRNWRLCDPHPGVSW